MGVDFAPGEGTPIRVIAGATVIKVQANDGGFGNDVWVQHDVDGKQFVSVYGHMEDNSFKVVKGQQVAVGDELGLVGSTGNSTGPHLHLEVRLDGTAVDPAQVLGLTTLIFAFVAMDGRSNWLEGAQLLVLYVIIAVVFFFLPLTYGVATTTAPH